MGVNAHLKLHRVTRFKDIIFSQTFQIWGQSHRVLMTFVHRMWFVTRSSLRDFPGSCIMMSWRLVERGLRKQTGKTETHQTVNIIDLHSSGRGNDAGVSKTWCTIRLEVTLRVFTNVTSCITNGSSVRKRISGPGPRIIQKVTRQKTSANSV